MTLLHKVLGLTVATAAAAAAASISSDSLSDFYGNTLVSRDHGVVSYFYYKPDHTFTGKVPAYYFSFKGTWTQRPDGTICRTFDPPLPTMTNPDCGPMLVHRLGEKEIEPNGDAEKLVAGIQ